MPGFANCKVAVYINRAYQATVYPDASVSGYFCAFERNAITDYGIRRGVVHLGFFEHGKPAFHIINSSF
jgi:hypothetical protein